MTRTTRRHRAVSLGLGALTAGALLGGCGQLDNSSAGASQTASTSTASTSAETNASGVDSGTPTTGAPASASGSASDDGQPGSSTSGSGGGSGGGGGSNAVLVKQDNGKPPTARPSEFSAGGQTPSTLAGITWSSWGGAKATGTGTLSVVICQPDCANGHTARYPHSVITLDGKQRMNGKLVYTRFTITANGLPAQYAGMFRNQPTDCDPGDKGKGYDGSCNTGPAGGSSGGSAGGSSGSGGSSNSGGGGATATTGNDGE